MNSPVETNDQDAEASSASSRRARVAAILGGLVALAAVVAIGLLLSNTGEERKAPPEWASASAPVDAINIKQSAPGQLESAAKAAGCELRKQRNEGNTHRDPAQDFRYRANPPTSGDHTPTWAEDGAYSKEDWSAPYLVHALEHGRIEYQWDAKKVSRAELGALKHLYDDDPYHLILAPNPTIMPYAIAAVAWDRSLTCPEMNDQVYSALRLFRLNFIDQGPEQVP